MNTGVLEYQRMLERVRDCGILKQAKSARDRRRRSSKVEDQSWACASARPRNSSTTSLKAAGCSRLMRCPAPGMISKLRLRDHRLKRARKFGRCHLVFSAADDQCGYVDRGRPVALVGEPHGLCPQAISVGVDPPIVSTTSWLTGGSAGSAINKSRALRPLLGGHRWRRSPGHISRGRRDARRMCRRGPARRIARVLVVHRDGDHAAERQASDMGAGDAELVGRKACRGVNGLSWCLRRRIAVAIAGIIEHDGSTCLTEIRDCGRQTALSDPTPWRRRWAQLGPPPVSLADGDIRGWCEFGASLTLAAGPFAALACRA